MAQAVHNGGDNMRVCDMCRKKVDCPATLKVESFLNSRYELCGKCAKKIVKYIRFEQKKNKRKGERE